MHVDHLVVRPSEGRGVFQLGTKSKRATVVKEFEEVWTVPVHDLRVKIHTADWTEAKRKRTNRKQDGEER